MRYPNSFTAADLRQIAAIASDLAELKAENPDALLPDPEEAFLAESMDLTWDFTEGKWDQTDMAIAYRPTPRALALLAAEMGQ